MGADTDNPPTASRRPPRPVWPAVRRVDTTLAVGAGGALGALARYGLSMLLPHGPTDFPWSTFLANVTGCFAIGVLMALIVDAWVAHRLLRPFVGVGVLGGFTTFSTYAVDTRALLTGGALPTAVLVVVGTPVAALTATWVGVRLTRLVLRARRSR